MKLALYSEGAPLLFAVPVYNYGPRMWAQSALREKYLGGHAMSIIGWDDNKITQAGRGAFIVRNSWGNDWCEEGYTWYPYDDLVSADEAAAENASEYPNVGYATEMPWEIFATVDVKDVIPDPEPEPKPEPKSESSKVPVWAWVLLACMIGIPLLAVLLLGVV
jgi:hypothetical protein